MILAWLVGLARTRRGTFIGIIASIAVTVGFLASLGIFMRSSAAEMTRRATDGVPIDWQVELVPRASADGVAEAMRNAARIAHLAPVGYAASDGFEASAGGTVQVTGPGKVVGIARSYAGEFPGNLRPLLGSMDGTLIAQQTAANLHVGPGDSVTIHRPGAPDTNVTIDGVVELPNADSMFQAIGIPPGAAPQAPPDNVLLLPIDAWQAIFDPQAVARPDTVRIQLHARLDHSSLPTDPQAAYLAVSGEGHNFEARAAGSAVLANNLSQVLDATREDALYAHVLFIFLGAPGVVAAVLLTIAVGGAGAARRRLSQSLLRLRGATTGFLLKISAAEALAVGIAASVIGIVVGVAVVQFLLSSAPPNLRDIPWLAGAAGAGIALSLGAVLVPAWLDTRRLNIAAARTALANERPPIWARGYLDAVLLVIAASIFWQTAASGYQIVLAPEGVAAVSVDYWAFLAPLLFWLGMALLGLRLTRLALRRMRPTLTAVLRPVSGSLATLIVSALAHQPRRVASGVGLCGLATAFAISISIFNATYQAQARVDAELTNGSDITVSGTAAAPADRRLDRLAALPGVAAAIPLQHRFAYVGTDLQDLYGIDPATIGRAATMSNAYFGDAGARATLSTLQSTPDGVLVSEETVTDFQLAPGDTINLRLQSASDHQYHPIPFRLVGVAREFPTAPRDSFLVANAAYVAKVTGNADAEVVLIRATGDPAMLRPRVAAAVSDLPGAKVRDINEATKLIGSSLTAIDLAGLTRLELAYAAILAACATGLMLALGVLDRRRSFAVMAALGATPRQFLAFLRGEAVLIFSAGALFGTLTGAIVAWMLVALLTGVFDPPPDRLVIPWLYLAALFATVAGSIVLAVRLAVRWIEVSPVAALREDSG
jgi:putative ABC transport system permease protein